MEPESDRRVCTLGRRGRDFWRERLLVISAVVNLVGIILFALLSPRVLTNQASLDDLRVETRERRDQSCVFFERNHRKAVRDLEGIYAAARVARRNADTYRVLVTFLPQAEAEAKQSRAPVYCDDAEVGLPEPNPEIPSRPRSLGVR